MIKLELRELDNEFEKHVKKELEENFESFFDPNNSIETFKKALTERLLIFSGPRERIRMRNVIFLCVPLGLAMEDAFGIENASSETLKIFQDDETLVTRVIAISRKDEDTHTYICLFEREVRSPDFPLPDGYVGRRPKNYQELLRSIWCIYKEAVTRMVGEKP